MTRREDVPSARELTAHLRTAVDGSVRWIDRALQAPRDDADAWDQRSFYSRMLLLRGLERGELLGWVLQRDALADEGTERAVASRRFAAYWAEARPDLHHAMELLRKAAGQEPNAPHARDLLLHSRDQLDGARNWLTDLAEGLAAVQALVEVDRVRPIEPPHIPLGLDLL